MLGTQQLENLCWFHKPLLELQTGHQPLFLLQNSSQCFGSAKLLDTPLIYHAEIQLAHQGVVDQQRVRLRCEQAFRESYERHEAKRLDDGFWGSSQGFEVATTRALFSTLRILKWCKQDEIKLRNKDFKTAPTLMITFGHIESGSEVWRVVFGERLQILQILLTGIAFGVLYRSGNSFDTSQVDSWSVPLYFSFIRSCDAKAFVRTRQ